MEKEYHTYKEIMGQAGSLELVYSDILDGSFDPDFLKKTFDETILFGCGTDYNLCQSACFFARTLSANGCYTALPSSELLINTDTYIKQDRKHLVIGFSRSGETTESINVLEKLKRYKGIRSFVFSATDGSTIIDFADSHFICRGALEESVAMTKAFTGFLFAYCLMMAKVLGLKEMMEEFGHLVDYLKKNLNTVYGELKDYIDKVDFDKYFALGSGFNYGIAVEADLKMKEMAATSSYSYHLHEFNHGPKTMLDTGSLCLLMTIEKNIPGIEKVLDVITNQGPSLMIVDSSHVREFLKADERNNVFYVLDGASFRYNLVRSFINIPVFQMVAFIKAIKKNLNPDRPRNLDFTTKI